MFVTLVVLAQSVAPAIPAWDHARSSIRSEHLEAPQGHQEGASGGRALRLTPAQFVLSTSEPQVALSFLP